MTSGEAVPVVNNVMNFAPATANFAMSFNGTLVYAPTREQSAFLERWCGLTVRVMRRRSVRRRVLTPPPESLPMAHGSRSTSAINRTTSGPGTHAARR